MPRQERMVKQGMRGAGSFCLVCLGVVILIPGAAITGISFSNHNFSEGLFDTMRIAGLVLLGVGVVLIALGCCLCCNICNSTPSPGKTQRAQIVRTPRSNQGVQQHMTPGAQPAIATGYAPVPGGAAHPAGGYVAMTPQPTLTQASITYNVQPAPVAFHSPPGHYMNPQSAFSPPPGAAPGQYPPEQYPLQQPAMMPAPQHSAPFPAAVVTPIQPYVHGASATPPAQPIQSVTFPQTYNPPQPSGIVPSAPSEDTIGRERPPSYEEAMSIHQKV